MWKIGRVRLVAATVLLTSAIAPTLLSQALFKTPVVASPFADGTYWYLREPLVWLAFDGRVVVVPAGFVTDFASVPKVVWNVLPKWEKYGPAAVVHDYLYWSQEQSRTKADVYFLEAMSDSNVSWIKKRTIYGAVRLFGGISWRANGREKDAKQVRVLKREDWPTNPSETWEALRARLAARDAGSEVENDGSEPQTSSDEGPLQTQV